MDFEFMRRIFPHIFLASRQTIAISLLSLVFSLLIAVIISCIIYHNVRIVTPILKIYVSFFRGTPALLQLYLIYFGLGNTDIPILSTMNAYTAVIVALSLNMSAYMAESLRGALSSVDKGQKEAGITIGLSNVQIFTRIVFPQAFRVAVPSLSNSFVDLVKGSSMAFTIGVAELMATANLEGIASFKFLETFFIATMIYWMLTLIINFLQRKLELYLGRAY
ncbi:amino acid ABC transporter permease [Tissierella praeacuta]|uniref:amino acid ABC transporter permease n=1 Tax=Tissierella praeacuta TaxID=43131 RepID=UPI0033418392